jgi:hypothetical protein
VANYDQEIYEIAISEGFKPNVAKYIVAQARLESADYTSNVFLNNFNMYGMKYVGQPLASRGTLAPIRERSDSCVTSNICNDSDYYAKYKSPKDSALDTIQRLYKKTRKGIGFDELNNSVDAQDFANKLKQRDYYGANPEDYGNFILAKLRRISIVEKTIEEVKKVYGFTKKNYIVIGIGLLITTAIAYWYYKNKYKK